ncbi:MAG: HAD family phosphatase [Bacteroidaceae bacterium]|nr:HAD family phosphatase [Bacteroidaceae bacterium]
MKEFPFKTALFDLDGVLIDTEPQYAVFWGNIGREFLPEMPDFANRIKGKSLVDIFDMFFPGNHEAQQRIKQRLLASERNMSYLLFPHVLEVVEGLKALGVNVAIVTSSDASKMQSLYASHPELRTVFGKIFTAENVTRSKPAPDCYINAARAMNTDVSRCIVFEDSTNGLISARDAGTHVVGLTTTMSKELVSQYADEVYPDLWEWWQQQS